MLTLKATFKRLGYAFILIFFYNVSDAQTDINTSFSDRMNYIFQYLEKNRVPDGLLLDYAMEFTNLSNFNGAALTDSNKVMTAEFWDIYNTLYLSRIHPSGATIQHPTVFDSVWLGQRDTGKIVLSGLFYNYSRFRNDAVSANLITVVSDQVYDKYVGGTWQNPYQTEKVFAIAPSIEYYKGKNFQVVLPSSLWQTNAAGSVSNIAVDLGDGLGYRTLTVGQQLSVSYTDVGVKVWKYRLQLSGGQYLYAHSQVEIKNNELSCSGCRFGATSPEIIPFTADEAYLGTAASGFITIVYRDQDRGLRRPLIVAEGFDAGHITRPESQFGSTDYLDFYDNVNVLSSGSQDLDDVIRNLPEYDVIYVDWRNGTDYLQRNALLLETIIRWVNNNKEPLPGGGFADNVILGVSMGGVITRWALRDMETRLGQQHDTRLFVSMDSPHQGANVPVAYQHMARHARSIYLQTNAWGTVELVQYILGNVSPLKAVNLADRPASRQMLINWINGNGNIDNSAHDAWQAELANLGYPAQDNIRNIAISNGAECGTTQPFLPGAEILNVSGKANTRFLGYMAFRSFFPLAGEVLGQGTLALGILPGRDDFNFELIANAQPAQGVTQRIYRGKVSFTKTVLWLIPVTVTLTEQNKNNNSTLLPMDYYGGGQIDAAMDVGDISFQNALVKFNISFAQIPTFSFVPTPSALDIGQNAVTLTNADYLAAYVGGAPPAAPRNTPFVNFVTAFNDERRNEQHTGFFQRNGDWLAQELIQVGNPPANPPVADCRGFCENGQIQGNPLICNNQTFTAPAGPTATYTWEIIGNQNLVTLTPNGNTVLATRIGTANGTATLRVTIDGGCGTVVLNLPITVGTVITGYYLISSNYHQPTQWTLFNNNSPIWLPGNKTFQVNVVVTNPNITSASWARSASSYAFSWGSSGSNLSFSGSSPSTAYTQRTGIFQLTANTGCGLTTTTFQWPVIASSSGFRVITSPNPAKNNLIVKIVDETAEARSLSRNETVTMTMYDMNTTLVVKQWSFKNSQSKFLLDVSGMKLGHYILVIEKGRHKQTEQVVIE